MHEGGQRKWSFPRKMVFHQCPVCAKVKIVEAKITPVGKCTGNIKQHSIHIKDGRFGQSANKKEGQEYSLPLATIVGM